MIQYLNFPAGESHCKGIDLSSVLYVPFGIRPLNDTIFNILLQTNIRRRAGMETTLFLPYLPYSRQDRPTSGTEPFSLKVFGDILNLQGYNKVYTLDVHSDAAYGCVNNLANIPTEIMISEWFGCTTAQKTLVIPDQGAYKRLSGLEDNFQNTVIVIKERDTSTGYLVIKHVVGEVSGKDCVIVDDICDGGMTFILIAQQLLKLGAASVTLAVTHGIFSKGLQPLLDAGITCFKTTNSFPAPSTAGVDYESVGVLDLLKEVL